MWAGGKTKVLKHQLPYLPSAVNMRSYSEPFFGGGAMFLHIMQTYTPEVAYINDVNEGIINIYRAVKEDPEEFCNVVDVFQSKYISLSKPDRKNISLRYATHTHTIILCGRNHLKLGCCIF